MHLADGLPDCRSWQLALRSTHLVASVHRAHQSFCVLRTSIYTLKGQAIPGVSLLDFARALQISRGKAQIEGAGRARALFVTADSSTLVTVATAENKKGQARADCHDPCAVQERVLECGDDNQISEE